jgi:hypothetical protein
MNNNDAAAFVSEIDDRIAGFVAEIREQAEAAKADLASGVLSLRSQAGAEAAAHTAFEPEADQGFGDVSTEASFEELTALEGLEEPSNGAHPLDAPIFGDSDSFLSDDLDFSIDLDENLPN